MNKNSKNQTIVDDEIDIKEIILILLKEKYLILAITLVFTIIGFVHQTFKTKVYQTSAAIRTAPVIAIQEYSPHLSYNQTQDLTNNYNKEFKRNLFSTANVVEFVEKNKKLDNFKLQLKEKNIDLHNYFKNKFKEGKSNKVYLNFTKPLAAQEFLNDYIFYIKGITEEELEDQMLRSLTLKIKDYKENFDIAKKLNHKHLYHDESGLFKPKNIIGLYSRGTIVLSHEIPILEETLDRFENFNLNYNPILLKPTKPELLSTSRFATMIIAFILGLFVSMMTIFIRIILSR